MTISLSRQCRLQSKERYRVCNILWQLTSHEQFELIDETYNTFKGALFLMNLLLASHASRRDPRIRVDHVLLQTKIILVTCCSTYTLLKLTVAGVRRDGFPFTLYVGCPWFKSSHVTLKVSE